MPDKTYVEVAGIGVKESFDNKYKSSLPRLMKERFSKAVDSSSKLTTKEPSDKNAEGFYVDGALALKRTDKGVEAELHVQLATWPKKSIFGMARSHASVEVPNPAKIDNDVKDVVDAVLDDAIDKAIKELQKRAK